MSDPPAHLATALGATGGDDDGCCGPPGPASVATSRAFGAAGAPDRTGGRLTSFRVEELDCATEEQQLRAALDAVPGVVELSFDLVARRVTVTHDLDQPTPLAEAIRHAGMRAKEIAVDDDAGATPSHALPRRTLITTVVAGLLAVGSEVVVIAGYEERSILVASMALTAIVLGGRDTLRKGFRALLARRLTMSLLMSVAVIGAIVIGQWPEAAVVIWLFGLAELIEALSLERARNAIRSLVELAPRDRPRPHRQGHRGTPRRRHPDRHDDRRPPRRAHRPRRRRRRRLQQRRPGTDHR